MFLTEKAEALFGGWKKPTVSRPRTDRSWAACFAVKCEGDLDEELEISVNTVNQYIQGIYRAKESDLARGAYWRWHLGVSLRDLPADSERAASPIMVNVHIPSGVLFRFFRRAAWVV